MNTNRIPARKASAACAAILSAAACLAQAEWSGSFSTVSGVVFPREAIPDDAIQDWYSRLSGSVRLRGGGDSGRFACEAWARLDPATGTWTWSLDEAWGQWSPAEWLSLLLGRSRISYGPCLAFNPANSFQSRDPFDSRSGKRGKDGLQSELRPLEAFWPDFPLGLSLQADFMIPPEGQTAAPPGLPALPDIDRSSGRARAVFLFPEIGPVGKTEVGQTELGLSADLRDLGFQDRPWASGAWLSADLAGWILAAEGALRSPGWSAGSAPADGGDREAEAAFGVSRKLGDFFFAAETRWSGLADAWQGYLRLAWSHGDFSAAVSALADQGAEAARSAFEAAWNASDELVVRTAAAWNFRGERWTDPGPLPAEGSVSLAAEWFF